MKTLTLIATYVVATAIIFVLPAILIAIIFPCGYYDVVTCPYYVAIMGFISLFLAGSVTDEMKSKKLW